MFEPAKYKKLSFIIPVFVFSVFLVFLVRLAPASAEDAEINANPDISVVVVPPSKEEPQEKTVNATETTEDKTASQAYEVEIDAAPVIDAATVPATETVAIIEAPQMPPIAQPAEKAVAQKSSAQKTPAQQASVEIISAQGAPSSKKDEKTTAQKTAKPLPQDLQNSQKQKTQEKQKKAAPKPAAKVTQPAQPKPAVPQTPKPAIQKPVTPKPAAPKTTTPKPLLLKPQLPEARPTTPSPVPVTPGKTTKWRYKKTETPVISGGKAKYVVDTPAMGGIRRLTKAGDYSWKYWESGSATQSDQNHWEVEASLKRLDRGGSGVMFGKANGDFMAVYLDDDKLYWSRCSPKSSYVQILSTVKLNAKHQKPGDVTMKVEIWRDKKAVACTINGTPYVFNNRGDIPLITHYGFFTGGVASKEDTTSILKKVTIRRE